MNEASHVRTQASRTIVIKIEEFRHSYRTLNESGTIETKRAISVETSNSCYSKDPSPLVAVINAVSTITPSIASLAPIFGNNRLLR